MNYNSILIPILSLIFFACQNRNQESQSKANVDHIDIETGDEKPNETISQSQKWDKTFNWSRIPLLKEQLKLDLERDPNEIDKTLIRFLDEYEAMVREFNNILFDLDNYDSLNTIAHAPDYTIDESAREFKKQAEKNGLRIASSEGMIYLTMNTGYLNSNVYNQLDSVSREFLSLYIEEIDNVCCEDAAIIISDRELVERAFNWGNLLERSYNLEYRRLAESRFNYYIDLVFIGIDNTPSFDWQTGDFNKGIFESMNEIIVKYPNSIASKQFKGFSEVLVSENFKLTAKVRAYLDSR